ncbi:hypothetical protein LZ30DRAFT_769287 [Colletotrichum cereale]|nr:hypothetical protein LZ30DRAFT_769287 [Colletotrichum cereale]
MVQEWEKERKVEWNGSQLRRLWRCHRDRHKQDFLRELLSPDAGKEKFEAHIVLFGGNVQYYGEVISILSAKEGYIQIPSDFTARFVMPLLRRLLRGRYDNETRDDYLDRTIRCFQRREGLLANEVHVQPEMVLQYTIRHLVSVQGDGKKEMDSGVAKLLVLLPTKKHMFRLDDIYQGIIVPRNLTPEARYDLLRPFFRHVKGYEMSLEDNSAPGLAKFQNLPTRNDTWPTRLFFSIDIKSGRALFERLVTAHPHGDFLKPDYGAGEKTVAQQTRAPGEDTRGDVEIVRCLLNQSYSSESRDEAWLNRARSVVEERKKKSQQLREASDRAFWAKSALNVCFAAGALGMVADTVLWARRFNKDFLIVKEPYGYKTCDARSKESSVCHSRV